jgi:methionine-S-sulfoxide reductase
MIAELIIGGGCFWCTEAMFLSLEGVKTVESGYSGGAIKNPSYKEVCSGETGHAECIKITYDPSVISYEDLIDIHLHSHDPTTLNRQGGDVGTQYRSVIFYTSESEKLTLESRLKEAQKDFENRIVTTLEKLTIFYPAEDYHQNYFALNKDKNPYCEVVSEKLYKMMKKYSHRLKSDMVKR